MANDLRFSEDEIGRFLLNDALRERGVDHHATRESWASLRHVAHAVQRVAHILREGREER